MFLTNIILYLDYSFFIIDIIFNKTIKADLFCFRWAAKECDRNGVENSPERKRTVLGELLFLIR